MDIQQLLQLALQEHQAGRLHAAEQGYRQVLSADPNNPDALHLLGVLAQQVGRLDVAVDLITRATQLHPAAAYFNSLGETFLASSDLRRAANAYQSALQLDQESQQATRRLAEILLDPNYRRAEIEACRQDLAANPNDLPAMVTLASLLHREGDYDQTAALLDKALSLNPNIPQAHWNRAMLLLLKEQYPQGWAEYEWRWQCDNFPYSRQNFPQPQWDGSDLTGRSLFVTGEGGFGDILMMVRYIPLLAERGATVWFGGPVELRPLLQTLPGLAGMVCKGDSLPPFDLHVPLFSLPHLFKTTIHTIPSRIPYLHPNPDLQRTWSQRVDQKNGALKVGITWTGRPLPYPNRSCPGTLLAPLAEIPNIAFYSLQKEGAADAPIPLIDLTADLTDFAHSAALLANLDLVISIDTAIAHLAGAMGKETWIMLPKTPDWRWHLDRTDCPWYPTARLFRQPVPWDWQSVITHLTTELRRRASELA